MSSYEGFFNSVFVKLEVISINKKKTRSCVNKKVAKNLEKLGV